MLVTKSLVVYVPYMKYKYNYKLVHPLSKSCGEVSESTVKRTNSEGSDTSDLYFDDKSMRNSNSSSNIPNNFYHTECKEDDHYKKPRAGIRSKQSNSSQNPPVTKKKMSLATSSSGLS
eukprot:Pgem_evm1s13829